MIGRRLIEKLFEGFSVVRWNDQIRPIEFFEMDKHAHKMAIAYCLARCEEENGIDVSWENIVKGGLFELLRRIVLCDIKAPIYEKLQERENKDKFRDLCCWVYDETAPLLKDIKHNGRFLREELREYLHNDKFPDQISRRILDAAHCYASLWEYRRIKEFNPAEKARTILKQLEKALDQHAHLFGIKKLADEKRQDDDKRRVDDKGKPRLNEFIDLVGQLRCQRRWSGTPRIVYTSVLGHSMMVASLSYLFSLELKEPCSRRLVNNFFGGLFHDLPEALTRDIIAPVKKQGKVGVAIADIELEVLEKEMKPILGKKWWGEVRIFFQYEFESKYQEGDRWKTTSSDVISEFYNENRYNPYDGELVKVADDLAACVEAYSALQFGIKTKQLKEGHGRLIRKYGGPKRICQLDFSKPFEHFKLPGEEKGEAVQQTQTRTLEG